MKKRIISFLMVVCLAISCVVSVNAADLKDDINVNVDQRILRITADILKFIEPEKELYGMADVDFAVLSLGSEIPSFIVDDGRLISSEIKYYPIMEGEKWVATAIVFYTNGDINVQVSAMYAKEYKNADIENEAVSFVFDDDGAYILTNENIICPDGKVETLNYSSLISQNENLSVLTEGVPLPLSESELNIIGDIDNQAYLSIPKVKQASGSMQCWAACVSSICGYYGISATIRDVYNKMGMNINDDEGATISQAQRALELYGLSTTGYLANGITWWQLRNEINNNENPIYTKCVYNNSMGHAVVIRGFYVYQRVSELGLISYMDPGEGDFVASTVAKDGQYYYVPRDKSGEYKMTQFAAVFKE